MSLRLLALAALAAGVTAGAAVSWRATGSSLTPLPTLVSEAPPSSLPSQNSGAAAPAVSVRPSGPVRGIPGLSSAAIPAQRPTVRAPRSDAASRDELLGLLSGFSGKSNWERQLYISGELFPSVGLSEWGYQPVPVATWWGEEFGNWDDLSNIYAIRRGSLPDGVRKRIVVGGHFDKVTYPGRSANPGRSDGILDNGSGVAALALAGGTLPQPQNDIVFIAMAAEEPPPFFNGSKAYFRQMDPTERAQVAAYINMDVLGRGRLAAVTNSAPVLAAAAAGRMEAEGIRLDRVPVSTNNNSDHLTAMAWGIPALALTCTDYSARDIHVPEDNLSAIDPEALYQHYLGARLAVMAVDELVAEQAAR